MLDGEICSHDVHMLEGYCWRHNNIMTQQLYICDRWAIEASYIVPDQKDSTLKNCSTHLCQDDL